MQMTKKIFFYPVCPGYCSTDINKHGPRARSPELGADSILYLVNTPNDKLENDAFYLDGKKLPEICIDEAKLQGYIKLTGHLKASM